MLKATISEFGKLVLVDLIFLRTLRNKQMVDAKKVEIAKVKSVELAREDKGNRRPKANNTKEKTKR